MISWTLLLINMHVPAYPMVTIPGFTQAQHCEAAIEEIRQNLPSHRIALRTVCVKVQ